MTDRYALNFRRTAHGSMVLFLLLALTAPVRADELRVMTSGGFSAVLQHIVPTYERNTSNRVIPLFGASMGDTPTSIPNRLARGESADVVILAGSALDELIKKGEILPESRVDLVESKIGMVVRAGAPKPDISSVAALRHTLLQAKSIAYSDSASGVYISSEMLKHLGVADQVAEKCKRIDGTPVAAAVARGEAEIGFQQISELLPEAGVTYVGALPEEVQKVTVFSAGIPVSSKHADLARSLIQFFLSPSVAPAIRKAGLDPIVARRKAASAP
jgi:molybdate transport system substrate-binding protein